MVRHKIILASRDATINAAIKLAQKWNKGHGIKLVKIAKRARAGRPLQTRQTKIQPWKSKNQPELCIQGCQAENKKTSKASLCNLILYVVIYFKKKFNFSNS